MTKLLLVEDHEELWDFLSRRLRPARFRRRFSRITASRRSSRSPPRRRTSCCSTWTCRSWDGWTVARTLREQASTLPIIALTAHAMSGDKAKALDAGCDDYHPKPVDFGLLLNQVDEALLRREEATA